MKLGTIISSFIAIHWSVATFGQAIGQDTLHATEQSLNSYADGTMIEKVFLHTNRSTYLTGEYMWLKAYVVNGKDHRPLDVSKVAYVEVLDQDNHTVVSLKLPLEGGVGHTAAFLPASMNSGNYVVRAYTRWMRNFSPDWFYHQVITIINPFKPLNQPAREENDNYDIQFFPEGGDLVAGLESRVAFRAVDGSGKGLNGITGWIIGLEGDTLSRIAPTKFGLGDFTISPKDSRYEVLFYDSTGKRFARKQLPQIKPQGYVMRLSDDGSKQLRVEVQATDATSQQLHLIAHTRLGQVARMSGREIDNMTVFAVDKEALGEGITHMTVVGESNKPLCERLYFKRPVRRMGVETSVSKKVFKNREKVTLEINANITSEASMSLSVTREDDLNPRNDISIGEYLLLTSDLNGDVESPAFYFSDDPAADELADILMLTHGWRRFSWNQKLEGTPRFVPEYRGHLVTGSVTPSADLPINNIAVYLSVPGKRFHLRGSKSDRQGNVLFEFTDFYGSGKLIMQTDWTKDSLYQLTLNNPFETTFSNSVRVPPLFLSPATRDRLLARSINMQIDNAYLAEEKNKIIADPWDSLPFYRNPDEKYFLDDYTRFGVMEEVMREYVPGVLVRKRQKSFYFLVLNDNNNTVFRNNSMVILDGVPVFDVNRIMEYDPLKIERLDVITNRYFYGALSFDGLVSYISYSGDLPDFELDDRALVQDYDGLAWQREFFAPVYETAEQKSSRIPDTRNQLLWKPDITVSGGAAETVTFYTSDVPGRYRACVQGISDEGEPGYSVVEFEVEGEEE